MTSIDLIIVTGDSDFVNEWMNTDTPLKESTHSIHKNVQLNVVNIQEESTWVDLPGQKWPGGVSVTYEVIQFTIDVGQNIGIGVVSAWLYDKIVKQNQRMDLKIGTQTITIRKENDKIQINEEEIKKALEESIETAENSTNKKLSGDKE